MQLHIKTLHNEDFIRDIGQRQNILENERKSDYICSLLAGGITAHQIQSIPFFKLAFTAMNQIIPHNVYDYLKK